MVFVILGAVALLAVLLFSPRDPREQGLNLLVAAGLMAGEVMLVYRHFHGIAPLLPRGLGDQVLVAACASASGIWVGGRAGHSGWGYGVEDALWEKWRWYVPCAVIGLVGAGAGLVFGWGAGWVLHTVGVGGGFYDFCRLFVGALAAILVSWTVAGTER